jgi:hypothetical protein
MLTIHSIRPTDNRPAVLPTPERDALMFYAAACATVVATLERHVWHHDEPNIGLHSALLAQARADRDAAQRAADEARRDYLGMRDWVREAV